LLESFHLAEHLEFFLINNLLSIFIECISHLHLVFSVAHLALIFFSVNSHFDLVNIGLARIKPFSYILDSHFAHFTSLSLLENATFNDSTCLSRFVFSKGTLLVHEFSLGRLLFTFLLLVLTHFRSL
jgi:hypothetical protein